MRYAFQNCGCIPWNYPQFEENQIVCHRFTQDCFEKHMDDTDDIGDYPLLPNLSYDPKSTAG